MLPNIWASAGVPVILNDIQDQTSTLSESKLSVSVFKTLRDRIVCLDYPQNFVLTEKHLCEEFGVSRTPLREAILKLESMHLVKSIPRYGTVVTQIDPREIRETYEVKKNLEGMAAREAAKRISTEQSAELEEITQELTQAGRDRDVRGMFEGDIRFHELIWRATCNRVLFELLEDLHARCLRFCMATVPNEQWGLGSASELEEIFAAIVGRKEKQAVELLQQHNQHFLMLIKDNVFE
jgi:DNA-binding GntR family transcriptional regulator